MDSEIAKMLAKMNLCTTHVDLKKPLISIAESNCGSGTLMLAYLKEFATLGIDYENRVIVTVSDVNKAYCHMAFLQLAHAGAIAIVQHKDPLTNKYLGEVFTTPALLENFSKVEKLLDEST